MIHQFSPEVQQVIAETLQVHQLEWIDHQVGWDCGCNEYGLLPGMPLQDDALAHQAEMINHALRPHLQDAMAETWEEGRRYGHSRAMRYMSDEPDLDLSCVVNPYGEQVTS